MSTKTIIHQIRKFNSEKALKMLTHMHGWWDIHIAISSLERKLALPSNLKVGTLANQQFHSERRSSYKGRHKIYYSFNFKNKKPKHNRMSTNRRMEKEMWCV